MNSQGATGQRGKPRLVVLGGFLGAGKTTAIGHFGKYLKERRVPLAVLANDHGSELVDRALLREQGLVTEVVAGGDLCVRSGEALRAAARLSAEHDAQVIIAEPAATCADIRSALLAPARKEGFVVAPLTVLVDAVRASRVLGLESGAKLTRHIEELYRRQLSEAEIVAINKVDLLSAEKVAALREAIVELCRDAKVFTVSTESGAGLSELFECLMTKESSQSGAAPFAVLDQVAEDGPGLAWLNCTIRVSSVRYFEAGKLLLDLAGCVQSLLQQEGGQIAHLKMALIPEQDGSGIAAVSLDRYDAPPKLLRDVSEPIQRGELILNARAQADPEILHSVVNRALMMLMERSPELFARMHHCEHFRPVFSQLVG